MKSRLTVWRFGGLAAFACAGLLLFAKAPHVGAQGAAADTKLFDPQLYNEVATLRVAVDELKVLVAGLKVEISARRTELSDLKTQVKQEQSALDVVRSQIVRERQTLASLTTQSSVAAASAQKAAAAQNSNGIGGGSGGPKDLGDSLSVINGTELLETIYFAPESSAIDAYYIPHLNTVGNLLAGAPRMKIKVRGYTHQAGTAAGRERLSRERAEQVAKYLERSFSIKEDRITVEWFGADEIPVPPLVKTTDRTRRAVQVFASEQ